MSQGSWRSTHSRCWAAYQRQARLNFRLPITISTAKLPKSHRLRKFRLIPCPGNRRLDFLREAISYIFESEARPEARCQKVGADPVGVTDFISILVRLFQTVPGERGAYAASARLWFGRGDAQINRPRRSEHLCIFFPFRPKANRTKRLQM